MREVARELSAPFGRLVAHGGRATAPPPRPRTSIAVLVFTNITQNAEDNWLGTGIMETVTADLKGIPGLTVIGCERICEVEKRLTGHASRGATELAIAARPRGGRAARRDGRIPGRRGRHADHGARDGRRVGRGRHDREGRRQPARSLRAAGPRRHGADVGAQARVAVPP